jgi:hypothetical protein
VPEALKATFASIDQLFASCSIDYALLANAEITGSWFADYNNQRIVNSFLFNYIKIQDKISAKLFRQVLLALREIPDGAVPMIDMLHLLEKLNIIDNSEQWDMLREVRNIIAHEYPADLEERIDNIKLALSGFDTLKRIYASLQVYVNAKAV